ncbi:hypothetical protein [Mycobacterium canetti]|uniref:hypothetical protein n=1 Tax=Mycobacterium canetti TaxID=78331 RepID=UPI0003488D55|nr:hypothetical protein [Mycobacterium canetti]
MTAELDTINHGSSLTVLPPARAVAASVVAMLHEHAEIMQTAYKLADAVCHTAMVPDRFRGKPQDGAAAILYGAELGLNPIQSLQRVIPIYGSPTLEARTMVALLKARGYKIRTVAQSDDSVTVHGESPDGETAESTWTIQRAIKARYVPEIDERTGKYKTNSKGNLIGNEKYLTDPQAMLKAKAQAEVCRDLAPEILLGIAYTAEEMESEQRPSQARSTDVVVDTIIEDLAADARPPQSPAGLAGKVRPSTQPQEAAAAEPVADAPASPAADSENEEAPLDTPAAAPFAPTANTPGQTERVAKTLNNARAMHATSRAEQAGQHGEQTLGLSRPRPADGAAGRTVRRATRGNTPRG